MMKIAVIDDEIFYQTVAKISLGNFANVDLFDSTDAFFEKLFKQKIAGEYHWILVDRIGQISDAVEENFSRNCRSMVDTKILLWSNLTPSVSDLYGYDGFLSKDTELTLKALHDAFDYHKGTQTKY